MFMYSIVGHKTSSLLCMGVNFRQDKMLPKLAWPVPNINMYLIPP